MSLLASVTKTAKPLPPRIVLYAAEKFGKSSFSAYSWNPIVLMTSGETGLIPLIESGRVPAVAHFPEDFKTWGTLCGAVTALLNDDHDYRTLVIDTGNGAEKLCSSSICDDCFGGSWVDYNSFGRGDTLAAKEWEKFLGLLDAVRTKRRMAVLILHHAKVKTFSDPAGKSWDQWKPEAIEKLWGQTHKWADVILFGGFKVTVNKRDDKATGEERYLRSDASAAIVAGNRYGLPAELTSKPGAENLWKVFADALGKAKGQGKKPETPSPASSATLPTAPAPATTVADSAGGSGAGADSLPKSPEKLTPNYISDLLLAVAEKTQQRDLYLIEELCKLSNAPCLDDMDAAQLAAADKWLRDRAIAA